MDIVEGTFRMYKIAIRKLLSPLKLFIHYKGGVREDNIETGGYAGEKNKKPARDLRIYYSLTNPKPEAGSCEGWAENTGCLTFEATDDRVFNREYLFLKLETTGGCQGHMKLVFPKQDIADLKAFREKEAAKARGAMAGAPVGAPAAAKAKTKL